MLKTILLVVLLGASQTPAAADSGVEGVWNTGSLDGRVQILRCGGKLCGRVIDGAALRTNPDLRDVRNRDAGLRQRRVKGLVVLQGFSGGPRDWSGGPVYDPQTGDGANSGRLKLRDDGKLEVKGCVAFICRTKVWTRVR